MSGYCRLHFDLARERRQMLLRNTAIHRTIRASRIRPSRTESLRYWILAQIGNWLIAWGWRLRARYGFIELAIDVQPPTEFAIDPRISASSPMERRVFEQDPPRI